MTYTHAIQKELPSCMAASPFSSIPQGVGEDIPHHLRADGPVRNRKIGRAEVNELVSGFWQHRLTSEETSQPVSGTIIDQGQAKGGSGMKAV